MKLFFAILLFCVSLRCSAQSEGSKAVYYDKPIPALVALIKNAEVFDTIDIYTIVYVREVKKKNGTVEKQYFTIEQGMDIHAQVTYKRKRVYPQFKTAAEKD